MKAIPIELLGGINVILFSVVIYFLKRYLLKQDKRDELLFKKLGVLTKTVTVVVESNKYATMENARLEQQVLRTETYTQELQRDVADMKPKIAYMSEVFLAMQKETSRQQ